MYAVHRRAIKFLSFWQRWFKGPYGFDRKIHSLDDVAKLPEGDGFVAFMNLAETGSINPGQELEARIWLPSPKAISLLDVGTKFMLWDDRAVAHGEVLGIMGSK